MILTAYQTQQNKPSEFEDTEMETTLNETEK